MKRKMMTREKVPSKKTTNGGNGAYMSRKMMQDKERGGHKLSPNMKKRGTATGRAVTKAM